MTKVLRVVEIDRFWSSTILLVFSGIAGAATVQAPFLSGFIGELADLVLSWAVVFSAYGAGILAARFDSDEEEKTEGEDYFTGTLKGGGVSE